MVLRSQNSRENIIGISLIFLGVSLRLLPHPMNFTPITAIALFSGVVMAPRISLFLPLIIMIVSDLWIGHHELYPITWGFFFAATLLGIAIRKGVTGKRLFFSVTGCSVAFFILSNLGVFVFQNMYEKSWAGLLKCYMMALPFFRNALLGDLFYSVVLFGVFAALKSYSKKNISQTVSS